MTKPMARNPLRGAMNRDNDVNERMESSLELEDWYRAIDPSRPTSKETINLASCGVPDTIRADYNQGVLKVSVRDSANP